MSDMKTELFFTLLVNDQNTKLLLMSELLLASELSFELLLLSNTKAEFFLTLLVSDQNAKMLLASKLNFELLLVNNVNDELLLASELKAVQVDCSQSE